MELLPAAFYGLQQYEQFIVYQIKPSTTRQGKTDKLPINPATGCSTNAHDSKAWLTADEAIRLAGIFGKDYGVGFVLTDNDPFWFLDIDNCVVDGKWSSLAVELMTALAGCAVEVSQSGSGLHIIGSGELPEHSCRFAELSIELYNCGRFVALTGKSAIGSVACNNEAIREIANKYFPPRGNNNGSGDVMQRWIAAVERGIDPRWKGSTDDEDLIRRACRPQGKAMFSERASFNDLWTRNLPVLQTAYPDPEKTDGYDDSLADAALAQHLCFWTGCDAERIRRLMQRSALYRDKYERGDYLPRTIVSSIDQQKDVCVDNTAALPDAAQTTDSPFLNLSQQAEYFAGCVYVADEDKVMVPRGLMYTPSVFKTMFGGKLFTLDATNSKTTKNAYEAFTESQVVKACKVDTTCFRPDLPHGEVIKHDGNRCVNTYWPIPTPSEPGDVTLFLNHIEKLCPVKRDADLLLAYMAAVVQHQGVKFQWCPFIQGVEGNGKTLLSRCVAYAVGTRYVHFPKSAEIASKFNDFMYGTVFIAVEDIYVTDGLVEIYEALKPMITADLLEIEPKGGKKTTRSICANFIINSNHKDGLRKTRNNRTFAPFYTAQQSLDDLRRDGMTGDYFAALYGWLNSGGYANVTHFLRNYLIPEEYNPATLCKRVPTTSCTEAAITQSSGRIEQEVMEAIASGAPGFRRGWISSTMLNELLDRIRASARMPRNKRRDMLAEMGYISHPALAEGRSSCVVTPDNNQPRLYVLQEHLTVLWKDPLQVSKQYEIDQR